MQRADPPLHHYKGRRRRRRSAARRFAAVLAHSDRDEIEGAFRRVPTHNECRRMLAE